MPIHAHSFLRCDDNSVLVLILLERWNVTFNMLLISLMDDTQPYRAEVRDRSVHS